MALHIKKNQYRGVNAHLHSTLQTPGTASDPSSWRSFHDQHVVNITEFLNARLPEGYVALNEPSLQILSEADGGFTQTRPEPDSSIFRRHPAHSTVSSQAVAEPTWESSIEEMLATDSMVDAVVIRRVTTSRQWGEPVTRIEVLSPSNKRGREHYSQYATSREGALLSGTSLVEIDYLHEIASPIRRLPVYPDHPDSHAYYIAVNDLRKSLAQGKVRVYAFDVDSPIPTLPIPLAGEDSLPFDFGEVYDYTYERGPWYLIVDYDREPERFSTYGADDQRRIKERMRLSVEQQRRSAP
jgi:hypothetical protein